MLKVQSDTRSISLHKMKPVVKLLVATCAIVILPLGVYQCSQSGRLDGAAASAWACFCLLPSFRLLVLDPCRTVELFAGGSGRQNQAHVQWRGSGRCCERCECPDPSKLCCNAWKQTETEIEQFKVLQVAYAFVVSAFREKDLPAPETKKQS